jgi:hypothetical protein
MEIIKNICLYTIIGLVVTITSWWLRSDYLANFLHSQIVNISITLVAITSAVRGLILGKITDLSKDREDLNFDSTFKELRISLYEQIVMIFISLVLLMLAQGKRFLIYADEHGQVIVDSLLTAIFIYQIYIVFDSSKAIIDIYIEINNKNKS